MIDKHIQQMSVNTKHSSYKQTHLYSAGLGGVLKFLIF